MQINTLPPSLSNILLTTVLYNIRHNTRVNTTRTMGKSRRQYSRQLRVAAAVTLGPPARFVVVIVPTTGQQWQTTTMIKA